MTQIRIRIFPEDLTEMSTDGNVPLQMQLSKPVQVEVWDSSEGDSRPLVTLEPGDYLEVVFE